MDRCAAEVIDYSSKLINDSFCEQFRNGWMKCITLEDEEEEEEEEEEEDEEEGEEEGTVAL